ncbi:MAG: hypothetical protein ABW252_22760 [Polyangiales bacterium]
MRGRALTLALTLLALIGPGCERFKRKHIPVDSLEELGYPGCDGKVPGPGETLAAQHLRSGASHNDKTIVERFRIEARDCLRVLSARQEWPLGTVDLEVVYDAELKPLRIWKRMTIPALPNAGERAELRRYELRTEPVGIKRRAPNGDISFEQLKGGRPVAVIGPGRGLISMWLRRAHLAPGTKVRELVIDVRALEKIELVTLMREPDMQHPELGPVRVYTFFGRETVFADENDVVIGDLMGLRPDRVVKTPPPPAIPTFGVVDPVGTP